MLDVLQLKNKVNQMSLESIRATVEELQLEGLVTGSKTPFNRVHFNTCFAEIEALLQRGGYHRQLDVIGYQGQVYALFDPARWEAVQVLRGLKDYVDATQAYAPARQRG
ncbi:transcriptional regulator [Aquipseudomonas ullengensis]|uniref:Transcriptional regulator n=1 Tax=Aquipseudomonas ullengensis TaxID=2759166 RepID=A0A7W4QBL4_9GAMM|nr:transcriptional regulator [Pseudomonas ullengensis]MBB2496575.1 transcriptional regulator [Pseudomonas ullengensis]